MTATEIADIAARSPTPAQINQAIDAKIAALEVKELLPRVAREYFLGESVAKAALQGYTEPQLYAASAAYKRLKDFDSQIAALRTSRV